MKETRIQLIEMARSICADFTLEDEFTAGGVGAAIQTIKGAMSIPEFVSILGLGLDSVRKLRL